MSLIRNWTNTEGGNGLLALPYGWPEGMPASQVNNVGRQMMASIRSQWEDAEWFDWGDSVSRTGAATFKVLGANVTSRYTVNRRIKCTDSSTLYGRITASSYSAPDTTVTVALDSGSLTSSLSAVFLSILSPTNVSIPVIIYNENNPIYDSSINELLKFAKISSAVNELTITNAATAGTPTISATGDDTNISLLLKGKGTGAVRLGQSTSTDLRLEGDQPIADSSGNELIKFVKTTNAVNEITVVNAATGNNAAIRATGDDSLPGLNIEDKSGNEIVKFSGLANAVNEITFFNNATGGNPSIWASGNDSTISIDFNAKGSGVYNFKGNASIAAIIGLYEQSTNGTNAFAIRAPSSLTADRGWTLPDCDISNIIVQRATANTTSSLSGTTTIPLDNTIPQNTEGDQVLTVSITPKSTTNKLVINFSAFGTASAAITLVAALFQDSTANALYTTTWNYRSGASGEMNGLHLRYEMAAGTTSSTTFKVRVGATGAATWYINQTTSGSLFSTAKQALLTIEEYTA
jgi:hypothetical protein